MEWITQNWLAVSAALGAVVTAIYLIAKLTPTDKDDKIAEKLKSLYDKFFRKS